MRGRTRRRWFGAVVAASAVVAGALGGSSGCGSDEPTPSTLADGCSINTDCNTPLVCAFRRCHNACETTRDCPTAQRCVASDRPYRVCQLPDEQKCTYHSECAAGQVCGVDRQCRNQCVNNIDCVPGQICTQGSCADPTELKDGKLPPAGSDAGADGPTPGSGGQGCTYNSECPVPLVCRMNQCAFECLGDRDCPGSTCDSNEHRCRPPIDSGASGAGGATGAGGSAGSAGAGPTGAGGSAGPTGAGGSAGSAGAGGADGGSGGATSDASRDAVSDGAAESCPALGWTRPCALCADGPTGTQTCADGASGPVWGACQGATQPETCDGKDNDCDGRVDDGASFECRLGLIAPCAPNAGCTIAQGTKECTNVSGVCRWGACRAGTEICNGLDDDCDDVKDNGPGMQCVAGTAPASCTYARGSCSAPGVPSCDPECKIACAPKQETCNGIDDDCDGTVDVNGTLGIDCAQGISEACSISACSSTFAGVRACSLGCTWGACTLPTEACDGRDNNCNDRIDEGSKYEIAGAKIDLGPSDGTNKGVMLALDESVPSDVKLWAAWTDTRLGSARMTVGKFTLAGAPLAPLADIGHGSDGIGAYGSIPYRSLGVMVGSDAYFVAAGPNPGSPKIVLVKASGGSASAPPALTATPLMVAPGAYVHVAGLTTDGTDLYLSYAVGGNFYPPHDLYVTRFTTAAARVWDVPIATAQQHVATLLYDGSALHTARCAPSGVIQHQRLSPADGSAAVPDHPIAGTQCNGAASSLVSLAISGGKLAVGSQTAAGATSFQFATIDAAGVLTMVGPKTYNFGYSGDVVMVGRAGSPATFAMATWGSMLRVAGDGAQLSADREPSAVGINANFFWNLVYGSAGPSVASISSSYATVQLGRLLCP